MRTSSKEEVDMNINLDISTTRGTRMSARQREKQRKSLIVAREREIARQQAGEVSESGIEGIVFYSFQKIAHSILIPTNPKRN